MTHTKHSDRRPFIASVLIILSVIGLFASLYAVASAVVLSSHLRTLPAIVGTFISLFLLAGACLILRDISALWQIPLQAFASSAIVVGVTAIVPAAFENWHLLLGSLGLRAGAFVFAGVDAGYLMRRLQVRLLPRQNNV